MADKYKEIIENTMKYGGILDVMLALQEEAGYVTEAAIRELAKAYGKSEAEIYDTASFYGMVRLSQTAAYDIRICRGAPCHVAGADRTIKEMEKLLDTKIGSSTKDGKCYFGYTECLGQCQSSPSITINEKLYTNVTVDKVAEILKEGGVL